MIRIKTNASLSSVPAWADLSAAISLATEGFSVELLEKNDKVGGKLNILTKDGFTFDLGPSILTMPHIFEALFTRAGKNMADYVSIEKVEPHWRNFFEDGTIVDLTPDAEAMRRELDKLGPKTAEEFARFMAYSKKLCTETEAGYFAKGLDSFWELLRFYGPLRSLLSFDVFRSMDQGVRRFISNPKLVDILNYFIKYVGSSPYDAPALMNLLPYIQFEYGLWYVKGGMYGLAKAMERLAWNWAFISASMRKWRKFNVRVARQRHPLKRWRSFTCRYRRLQYGSHSGHAKTVE